MHSRKGVVLLLWALLMVACGESIEHNGKTPLMRAGNSFLYREDLQKILPYGLSGEDSILFVNNYMREWAEEQVLYEKAERNIRSDEWIDRMVDDYRRMLIMNDYERKLLQQQMSGDVSEEELQRYYEENKQLFVLEETVIKGVFVKAPLTSPDLKSLKKWYKDSSDEAMELMEKYAFRNAVIYELFYEHWLPVSELEAKFVLNLATLSEDFAKKRDFETEDDEYCYLLHVEEYVPKGMVKPYELAKLEIMDLLANNRKVEFMKKVKKDLYNQSLEKGRIIYYGNETMQIMDDTVHNASHNIIGSAR